MPKYWPTLLGLFVGLAAIAAGLLSGASTEEGWQLAARWTARASFPLLIVTFVASALVRLYPSTWSKALLRERRWWGLGFAACFTAHVVALHTYNWLIGNFPPASATDGGVIAYAVLLAMVLTSTDAARKALGRGWKWLHTIGIWGFVLIFGHPDGFPLTDPYFVIAAAAVGLKLAAFVQARRKRTRRAA